MKNIPLVKNKFSKDRKQNSLNLVYNKIPTDLTADYE